MSDIFYTYQNQAYANITNLCNCRCKFCIRSQEDAIGEAQMLWHKQAPTLDEVLAAMDAFDFTGYKELVFCGYGEPTCALDTLLASARYAKERYGLTIRLNTNGLGNLYHKKNIVPLLATVIDSISISLNAPTKEQYNEVSRPAYADSFDGLLAFAVLCRDQIPSVRLSIVDVLAPNDITACQTLADALHITLRIRRYAS